MAIKSRHIAGFVLVCLGTFAIFGLLLSSETSFLAPRAAMSLTHTVLFQFKTDAKPDAVKAACARFLGLKEDCVYPTSHEPYILSLKGGKDNSIENMQNGITHGFVVEFGSSKDRDYYVNEDPAHKAFVKSIGDLIDKAIVVDFTSGEY